MRNLRPILMAAMLGLGLGGSPMALAQGGRAAQSNEARAPQAKVSVRIATEKQLSPSGAIQPIAPQ